MTTRKIDLNKPYSLKYEKYKQMKANTSAVVELKNWGVNSIAAKEYNSVKKIDKLSSRHVPKTKQLKGNSGNILKKTNTSLKVQGKRSKKGYNLNTALQDFNKLTKRTSEDPLAKSQEVHFESNKPKLENSSSSQSSNLSSEMERGTGISNVQN